MALSFTRPQHIQVSAQIGLGGCGSDHRHGGRGLLLVLVHVLDGPGVAGGLNDLVQPGYEWLGHGSLRAEHQLLHR